MFSEPSVHNETDEEQTSEAILPQTGKNQLENKLSTSEIEFGSKNYQKSSKNEKIESKSASFSQGSRRPRGVPLMMETLTQIVKNIDETKKKEKKLAKLKQAQNDTTKMIKNWQENQNTPNSIVSIKKKPKSSQELEKNKKSISMLEVKENKNKEELKFKGGERRKRSAWVEGDFKRLNSYSETRDIKEDLQFVKHNKSAEFELGPCQTDQINLGEEKQKIKKENSTNVSLNRISKNGQDFSKNKKNEVQSKENIDKNPNSLKNNPYNISISTPKETNNKNSYNPQNRTKYVSVYENPTPDPCPPISKPQKREVNIGGYQINLNRPLGKGAYGSVYVAERHDRKFAIKRILKSKLSDRERVRRLIDQEKEVLRKINHPNIIKIFEFLETNSSYFIIMQYCPDGDLTNYLQRKGPLPEHEALIILVQIMSGFKELHRLQVMHRDFKPDNVFLKGNKVIIGDFGFAKSGFHIATTVLGTPYYIAPEILQGEGPVAIYTNKVDLWSIGVTFYQILFGVLPWVTQQFSGRITKEFLEKCSGINLKFPEKPIVSKMAKNFLRKIIEPNPEKRMEWHEFFSHPIFVSVPDSRLSEYSCQIRKKPRTMSSDPSQFIAKLYGEQAKLVMSGLNKITDPEQEQKKKIFEREKIIKEKSQILIIMKKAIDRFRFEINQFQFIAKTAFDLQNLSRVPCLSSELKELFYLESLLCFKISLLYNIRAQLSLARKQNMFHLEGFEFFCGTEYCSKLLSYLQDYFSHNQAGLELAIHKKIEINHFQSDWIIISALCHSTAPDVASIPQNLKCLCKKVNSIVSEMETDLCGGAAKISPGNQLEVGEGDEKEVEEPEKKLELVKVARRYLARIILCANVKQEFEYVFDHSNIKWKNLENQMLSCEFVKITIECFRMEIDKK